MQYIGIHSNLHMTICIDAIYWYLLIFIDIYWYLLIFIDIDLIFIDIDVIFIDIYWYSLIFVDIYWYSLIFVDIHSWIFIDICWYLLIFIDIRWFYKVWTAKLKIPPCLPSPQQTTTTPLCLPYWIFGSLLNPWIPIKTLDPIESLDPYWIPRFLLNPSIPMRYNNENQ